MISATSQPSRYIHSKIFSSLLNHIIKNSDFQLNEAEFKKLSDNQVTRVRPRISFFSVIWPQSASQSASHSPDPLCFCPAEKYQPRVPQL